MCSTNLGFSGERIMYLVPDTYVPYFMIPGTYSVLCTRYVWYQVRIMYQIRMYHTCRCTINSTAVSLFVYSLVGGGTHDTNVPPVDAHVWRQLHLPAVARCSDSYCIFYIFLQSTARTKGDETLGRAEGLSSQQRDTSHVRIVHTATIGCNNRVQQQGATTGCNNRVQQ